MPGKKKYVIFTYLYDAINFNLQINNKPRQNIVQDKFICIDEKWHKDTRIQG